MELANFGPRGLECPLQCINYDSKSMFKIGGFPLLSLLNQIQTLVPKNPSDDVAYSTQVILTPISKLSDYRAYVIHKSNHLRV